MSVMHSQEIPKLETANLFRIELYKFNNCVALFVIMT